MVTEEQRLIILKALRDSYANLTAKEMTEKEFDNLTNAMTIVKNCSITDVVGKSEQLKCDECGGKLYYDYTRNYYVCKECKLTH